MRAAVRGCTDYYGYNLWATLDGKPLRMQRVQSVVFEISLPKDNIYDTVFGWSPCPQGVYSPAVDDGYYVLLLPLKKGSHTLTFHADDFLDVTYNLIVVPVKLK